MKTTITIEFSDADAQSVADLTRRADLGLLIRDMCGEFQHTRQPAASYVAKRYEVNSFQNQQWHARKVREVEARNVLAALIARGDLTIILEGEST